MSFIRTVLGDIDPESAGLTLAHEHTLFGWPGVEHDHRSAFVREHVLKGLTDEVEQGKNIFGLGTLVDCTTIENNRYPDIMREVSQASGVNIVCEKSGFSARAWASRTTGGANRSTRSLIFSCVT